jgi:hypothetical protein
MSWLPNWILGVDEDPAETERRGAAGDDANAALNAQLHDQGLLSDSDYRITQAHIDQGRLVNVDSQINAAFWEGVDDGAANIRGAVGSTINTAIGTPLKLIPWQLWVAGALYLAFRLGLLDGILKTFLKGKR